MSYGFKLTGVTIPDGTTSINAVISDGTTPTEYALTGSVADGFSGTGASLSIPVIKLDDDAAVITADSVYNINAEVSAWLENLTDAELVGNDIYVNGNRLPFDEVEGAYLYIEDGIAYGVVPPREEGQPATFTVLNVSTEEHVPGTYHLVIYAGPATFNLTINALTADDVGDEYTINLSLPEAPTQAFKEAIEMAMTPLILQNPPQEFYTLIAAALGSAIPDVIAADGKFVKISNITWNYNGAEDKTSFENFEANILDIIRHKANDAYDYAGNLITFKKENVDSNIVGGTMFNFEGGGYYFVVNFKYRVDSGAGVLPRAITYQAIAALTA